jgi:L-methionine (R)-S-oxide reductase
MNALRQQLESILECASDASACLSEALNVMLDYFDCQTGTVHRLNSRSQDLRLVAQRGLPPAILAVVGSIPIGKGIAGQTAAGGEPVTLCNLQTDASGTALPGARQTGVGGALCVPVRDGDVLAGTLGIGSVQPRQFTPGETQELLEIGRLIAPALIRVQL